MQLNLNNRVAVILAASKGLGKSTAMALASEGCKVAICARTEATISATAVQIANQTGAEVYFQSVDVAKSAQLLEFIEKVNAKWGQIDILVTNAGGPPVKNFEETTEEEWEKYFNITLMSVIRSIRAVLPSMKKKRWGRIINITSISVKEPIMNLIYSNTLRLAVIGLAKTLASELGEHGITVHNVAPGFHRTEGLERIVKKRVENGESADEVYRLWEESIPLKRIGEPEDLAGLITFLASERAAYMTGTTILVDGGKFGGLG